MSHSPAVSSHLPGGRDRAGGHSPPLQPHPWLAGLLHACPCCAISHDAGQTLGTVLRAPWDLRDHFGIWDHRRGSGQMPGMATASGKVQGLYLNFHEHVKEKLLQSKEQNCNKKCKVSPCAWRATRSPLLTEESSTPHTLAAPGMMEDMRPCVLWKVSLSSGFICHG